MSWKEWGIGEVVEAGDFQTYVQDQTVQNYATSAARGSALGTAVAEGMVSYLQDSNSVQYYDGSAWQAVAPLSHNYIINGAFDIWQRGTSLSGTGYLADRWLTGNSGSTVTTSQQSFTPADLNIIGFGEASFYNRCAVTSVAGAGNFVQWLQRVEDVRTLASQVVTLSYWAKADSSKSVAIELQSAYGSGGSSTVNTFIVKQALTTSWARYSHTFTMPSVSGKTIGTGSYSDFRWWLDAGSNFDARTDSVGQQNITFDIWGVQLEAGSVATPFKRNAPNLQGELAACQRYYQIYGTEAVQFLKSGQAYSGTQALFPFEFTQKMRTAPTISFGTTGDFYIYSSTASGQQVTSLTAAFQTTTSFRLQTNIGASNLSAGNATLLFANGAGAKIEASAEL